MAYYKKHTFMTLILMQATIPYMDRLRLEAFFERRATGWEVCKRHEEAGSSVSPWKPVSWKIFVPRLSMPFVFFVGR